MYNFHMQQQQLMLLLHVYTVLSRWQVYCWYVLWTCHSSLHSYSKTPEGLECKFVATVHSLEYAMLELICDEDNHRHWLHHFCNELCITACSIMDHLLGFCIELVLFSKQSYAFQKKILSFTCQSWLYDCSMTNVQVIFGFGWIQKFFKSNKSF